MKPDDKICYCYHVSLRKLVNFARRERPRRPSQMSECLGAGTGCGWCIPILRRIYEAARRADDDAPLGTQADAADGRDATNEAAGEEMAGDEAVMLPELDVTPEEYARQRDDYRRDESRRHRW